MSSTDEDDEPWWENPEPDPPDLGPETPSVDDPVVEVPGSLSGDEDVDPEVAHTFWRLVLVFDVALLALSLGPMFVFFRGNWSRGLLFFAFGAVTFAYGVFRYRRFRADEEEDEDEDGQSEDRDGREN